MMKNKIKALGIVALVATTVIVMTACAPIDLDVPTGVTATRTSNTSVHITWDAVQDAVWYTVYFRTNMDSLDTRRPISGGSAITTFTHNHGSFGLPPGDTWYYFVRAHNRRNSWEDGHRVSGYSAPVSVPR